MTTTDSGSSQLPDATPDGIWVFMREIAIRAEESRREFDQQMAKRDLDREKEQQKNESA